MTESKHFYFIEKYHKIKKNACIIIQFIIITVIIFEPNKTIIKSKL